MANPSHGMAFLPTSVSRRCIALSTNNLISALLAYRTAIRRKSANVSGRESTGGVSASIVTFAAGVWEYSKVSCPVQKR